MGTRHLVAVVKDGEYKVAQYGQWDGYPSGQGVLLLDFLKGDNLSLFAKKISEVSFMTNEELQARWVEAGAKPEEEWVPVAISNRFAELYPENTRNTSADVLNIIQKSDQAIRLVNSLDFAGDSLFCEWGYVIDLDKQTFEVYEGYNKEQIGEHERFYFLQENNSEYYPIRLAASFSLDALPSEEEFLNQLEEEESN